MHTIKHGAPIAPLFKPGTILWRNVGYYGGYYDGGYYRNVNIRVHDIKFEPTEKGSFMGRVHLDGYEPTVGPNRLGEDGASGKTFHGIAVFIKSLPPEGWTHLVVTGVSKALQHPYDPEQGLHRIGGGAIFAEPAKPYDLIDFMNFRKRMFEAHGSTMNEHDFAVRKQVCLDVQTNEVRPEHCRLVIMFRYNSADEVLCDYCHIRQLAEAEKVA